MLLTDISLFTES